MKFFLDSAHVHEIAHGLEMWNVDGVTTNPRVALIVFTDVRV
jgi:transaldolase